MRRSAFVSALLWGALLAGAVPERSINTFVLKPKEGTLELEWVSPSTLHVVRSWQARSGPRKAGTTRAVAVSASEEGGRHVFETRYLRVSAGDGDDSIEIRTAGGAPLTELRVRREGAGVVLEQPVKTPEHFYGLGARTGALDVRGTRVSTRDAFLISSAGYGEFFPEGGESIFDLAATQPDAIKITLPGDRLDVFVHFGPTIKEILEEHMGVTGPPDAFEALDLEIRDPKSAPAEGSWQALAEGIHALVNASISAHLVPAFDLSRYMSSDASLKERAGQIASLIPILYSPTGVPQLQERRRRLAPYVLSYTREARDRGFPLIRPMVTDFAGDAAVLGRNEQFMFGDELLVAPVVNPSGEVKIYFPRGVWTDVDTDQTYKGRQEITHRPAAGVLPTFARNGSLVPLAQEGGPEAPIELHYFPSLGAEFFLAEESDPEVSQFHAAPAGDLIRLESESRVDRTYEWVLHHNSGCRTVESSGKEFTRVDEAAQLAPDTWYFDAGRRRLHVRVRASAGGDEIVHVRM